ncbi:hypothetical protein NPIL_642551 [Nephila pilipes]|uniref:Uncharacterized protein n=1 Tax=Nephila pilipes TaxID=299642 RepID=A0A8X6TSW9_NEPPI|nr:hypothetical protein NPIL_642551 [Nephila pilipes]
MQDVMVIQNDVKYGTHIAKNDQLASFSELNDLLLGLSYSTDSFETWFRQVDTGKLLLSPKFNYETTLNHPQTTCEKVTMFNLDSTNRHLSLQGICFY